MSAANMHPLQRLIGWALLALAVPLMVWVCSVGRHTPIDPKAFVFGHTVIEVFAVIVAMMIFVTGYRAILSLRKGAVVFLGVAFLGVGLLDFLHFMSYVGMPDSVTVNSPHKSMYFWLLARLTAAIALLVYVLLPPSSDVSSQRRRWAVAGMLVVVAVAGATGLFWSDQLPQLFIASEGPTKLKVGLEWFVVVLNVFSLVALWYRRKDLAREATHVLAFALSLAAVSELFFTQIGIVDKDLANAMGHFYKVASYLYLFQATFNESLRRPLERMEVQHLREKVVLNAAPDGVLWVNGAGRILMANPAMELLSGYTPAELEGQGVEIFLPETIRISHAHSMHRYFSNPYPRAMGSTDLRLMRKDGQMLSVSIGLGDWEDDGERHAIAYIRDLTDRKKYEESLHYQATHDELTGLANRRLFRMKFNEALTHAQEMNCIVAVLLLDLDYFKSVNDSFGHAMGDALLIQVGVRIREKLRPGDTFARMGGDEFGILMRDLEDIGPALEQAQTLLAALQRSFTLNNENVYVGGSVGLALYPTDGSDSESLLRFADMALYQAKDSGRGMCVRYSASMEKRVHEDLRVHTRLKEALALGQLQMHYQPQVDVSTGAVVGVEALARWTDAELGCVSPSTFIPIAEATGLILPLSDWVLETACAQMAEWMRAGTPLRIAVNISAQQFRQRDLPEKVQTLLTKFGVSGCWLDIEITESIAMFQPEHAREQLNALAALGCSVALDDFGTGHSSLSYLKALPVNKLKIDKSFMDGVPGNVNDVRIARAIIALANSLGLTLVAEGIETAAQLDFLREHACDTYQGWFFAKAMPAQDIVALLCQGRSPSSDEKKN